MAVRHDMGFIYIYIWKTYVLYTVNRVEEISRGAGIFLAPGFCVFVYSHVHLHYYSLRVYTMNMVYDAPPDLYVEYYIMNSSYVGFFAV